MTASGNRGILRRANPLMSGSERAELVALWDLNPEVIPGAGGVAAGTKACCGIQFASARPELCLGERSNQPD